MYMYVCVHIYIGTNIPGIAGRHIQKKYIVYASIWYMRTCVYVIRVLRMCIVVIIIIIIVHFYVFSV